MDSINPRAQTSDRYKKMLLLRLALFALSIGAASVNFNAHPPCRPLLYFPDELLQYKRQIESRLTVLGVLAEILRKEQHELLTLQACLLSGLHLDHGDLALRFDHQMKRVKNDILKGIVCEEDGLVLQTMKQVTQALNDADFAEIRRSFIKRYWVLLVHERALEDAFDMLETLSVFSDTSHTAS